MALTSLNLGKLKIAGHVREELDRSGIHAQSIECRSGGLHMVPGTARLTIVVNGTASHLDLQTREVEDCEVIVAGETWYKIDAFIRSLTAPPAVPS
jgi:hypothetical protein